MTVPVYTGDEPVPQPAPRAPQRWSTTVVVLALVTGLVFGASIVGLAALGAKTSEPLNALSTQADRPMSATPAAPTTSPAAARPTPSIEDGVWTVGDDIPAGRYRVAANLPEGVLCYWKIVKTGTNDTGIISQGLPQGGRPQVTLSGGQDFGTQGCGTWLKVS